MSNSWTEPGAWIETDKAQGVVSLPIMTTPFPPKSLLREHKFFLMESSTKKMFLFDPCTQNWSLCSQVIIYPHFPRGLGHKKPPPGMWISPGASSPWISLSLLLGTTQSMKLEIPEGNIQYQVTCLNSHLNVTGRSLLLFNFLFMTSCKSI